MLDLKLSALKLMGTKSWTTEELINFNAKQKRVLDCIGIYAMIRFVHSLRDGLSVIFVRPSWTEVITREHGLFLVM